MRVLADDKAVADHIQALGDRIREAVAGRGPWALVGIRSRGDLLAERLAATLEPQHLGAIDITLYRDDLSEIGPQAVVRTTQVDFPLDGLEVVLVDDVLMTGRSIRAALQSLMDLGRPRRVWLAVLVDRGGRELPICPDFVGLDLSDGRTVRTGEEVRVALQPLDAHDAIELVARTPRELDTP